MWCQFLTLGSFHWSVVLPKKNQHTWPRKQWGTLWPEDLWSTERRCQFSRWKYTDGDRCSESPWGWETSSSGSRPVHGGWQGGEFLLPKAMASPFLILYQSGIPPRTKRDSLLQEGIRCLRNMGKEAPDLERREVMYRYMNTHWD